MEERYTKPVQIVAAALISYFLTLSLFVPLQSLTTIAGLAEDLDLKKIVKVFFLANFHWGLF